MASTNDFDLDLNKDDENENSNNNSRISTLPCSSDICLASLDSAVSMITTTTQWTTDPGYTESKC